VRFFFAVLLTACTFRGSQPTPARDVFPFTIRNESQTNVRVRVNGYSLAEVGAYQDKTVTLPAHRLVNGGCATATATGEAGGRTVTAGPVCIISRTRSFEFKIFDRQRPEFIAW